MIKNFAALVIVVLIFFNCIWLPRASCDIIQFQVTGNGGVGLVGGNVNPVTPTNPGSGGIGSTGIKFNSETNILHIDIKWGSENGFTDLTGIVTNLHLHGMTADPAPGSFNQTNSNILINLKNSLNFDGSATSGGLVDNYFIGNPDVQGLLEGRTYINLHTAVNDMGEIRGYLVVVPEPGLSGLLLVLICFSWVLIFARSRSSVVHSPTAR